MKNRAFRKACAVTVKCRKCKNICSHKDIKLKSSKEVVAFCGLMRTSMIQRRKNCLLKNDNHFHGVRSVPALLNRGYYCHECDRGFNTEDAKNHNCSRQNCDKCRRKNGKCVDFKERKPANVYCQECGQSFRGKDCFNAHKAKRCQKFKKYPECCNVYKF